MTTILLGSIFLFGLIIGSFLNVVVLRWGEKTLGGRSGCMTCMRTLSWYELVPVLSWILQRGKCRGCKDKISCQYPLVELATGLAFVFGSIAYFVVGDISLVFGLSTGVIIGFIALLVALSMLVAIFVYDLKHQLIPDGWSLTFALASLVYSATIFTSAGALWTKDFWWHLAAGPILFLPFYLLWKVSDGRWIGLGDGKLAVGIGWLLGLSLGLSAVVFSFWIGAIFAIIMIIIQKSFSKFSKEELTMKTAIAFGPFMIIATLLVFWFGMNTLQFIDALGRISF